MTRADSESLFHERCYWVVSPNVRNNEATVGDWRQASVRARAAFMGWEPGDYGHSQIGPKFAGRTRTGVMPGDVILIARRHMHEPEIVGFGVVLGRYATRTRSVKTPDTFGSMRRLKPFKPWSRPPPGLMDVVRHTKALVQLHPKRNEAHKKVCEWMQRRLQSKPSSRKPTAIREATRKTSFQNIATVSLPESHQLDYLVRTKRQVRHAQKIEAKLVDEYRRWLARQGRRLVVAKCGRLQCDAYEKQRQNLIEAKSSQRREYIRMAVGQLLDYAFQVKNKFGDPNKAILLPQKPDSNITAWLQSLEISVIWREQESFLDNANGQFS